MDSDSFMCPMSFHCAATALKDSVSLTWGTRSEWGCDRSGEKLWGICRSRAAPLRSGRRRTSPRWDLPPAPLSSQAPAARPAEDAALSQRWTPIWGPGPEPARTPSAVAEASTEPRCCCPAGWSLRWTAPGVNDHVQLMSIKFRNKKMFNDAGNNRLFCYIFKQNAVLLRHPEPTSFSYKTDFILVLRFVLDDDNGPRGRPSSALSRRGRRRLKSRLPGNRP